MDLRVLVEAGGDLLDDEVGHGGVDLAGQLDEAGAEVEFAWPSRRDRTGSMGMQWPPRPGPG